MGARPDVDALTPVKFPKCFGLSRKRYPGSIRQLIMDRGMLWNFDRARTFRPMVVQRHRQATVAAVFETPRVGLLSGGYGREELERAVRVASTKIRPTC